MPINYLIIQSLRKFGEFYDGDLKIEYPTNSGKYLYLNEVADELTKRVISIFEKDEYNNRRYNAAQNIFYTKRRKIKICFYFMNISRAIQGAASVHRIKPAGRQL